MLNCILIAFHHLDYYVLHYPIIVFTETWLKLVKLNSKVFLGMYTVYRHDRPIRPLGGVLIAVRSTLKSEEVLFPDETRNPLNAFICLFPIALFILRTLSIRSLLNSLFPNALSHGLDPD